MTKFWINPLSNNDYQEGDQPTPLHVNAPQRPDWTYDWNGVAWIQNAARLAQLQIPAKDSVDLAVVKADATLTTFVAMTPAQVDAWIVTNVVDLPSARNAIKILAKIVLVIARQSLR